MTLALYIHWPFCRKKCPYCDFNSHVREHVAYAQWQEAMLSELRHMVSNIAPTPLTSIFFGGGTPSLMPPTIVEALLHEAERLLGFADDIEITLEANPTSSEATRFSAYRSAGVNRLSLGVQALNEADLHFLGREHSADEALRVVEMAANIFPRYSFDLIYARPHQTLDAWEAELRRALTYARGHVSLYQLTVEHDTPFARLYAAGGFTLPDDERANALYDLTEALCAEAGLARYEVSNYAAPSHESHHNLTYWRGEPYIGIGAGAHGRLLSKDNRWIATNMLKSPERWLYAVQTHGHGIEQECWVGEQERAEEILLGGLRLAEGIAYARVQSVINPQKLAFLQQDRWVTLEQGQLRITPKARHVMERVVQELVG
jgi:putative oxygen-independent coproporphyrinogen III oxidase